MLMPSILRWMSEMTIWSFLFSSLSISTSYSSSSSRQAVSTSRYRFSWRFSSSSRLNTLLYFSISEANSSFILMTMLFFSSNSSFRCEISSQRCCELDSFSELFSVDIRNPRLCAVRFYSNFQNFPGPRSQRFSRIAMQASFSRRPTLSRSFSLCRSPSNFWQSSWNSSSPVSAASFSSKASCLSWSSSRPLAAGMQYICCTRYLKASASLAHPSLQRASILASCLQRALNWPMAAPVPRIMLPTIKASSLSMHLTQESMARMPARAVWMEVFFSTASRRVCSSSERSRQISMLRHLAKQPSCSPTIVAEIFLMMSSLASSRSGCVEETSSWLGKQLSSILIFSLGRLLARKLIKSILNVGWHLANQQPNGSSPKPPLTSLLAQALPLSFRQYTVRGVGQRFNEIAADYPHIYRSINRIMGNNSSDSSNPFYASDGSKESELSQLLQQFTFVSVYEDELFGRCSIIEHKESKELIITKEVVCQNEAEVAQLYCEFERRKNTFTNINLLRLRYIIKKKTEGIFSDEHKIILFFDYIVTSLTTEFKSKLKAQKSFTNEEINIITCGALRGYAALEQEHVNNNKVKLSNIYFGLANNMPLPKVIDSNLFPTPTNMQLARKQENVEDVFLAPEELKNMEEGKYYNPKSGVFSLAISLVQLCLLTPSKDLYNYNKRTINYTELENRLNIVKNKYPLSIYCLLRDMLERNDDSRPSFVKLAETLPSNLKNLPTTLNISLTRASGENPQASRASSTSNGFSKVLNPLSSSRNSKRMTGTLVSQYRPEVEVSEIYTNGNRYEGQKKDNFRHGKGKYIYNDGSYYLGDWIKGKMEGQGQLYDPQGNLLYDGAWKDDHYEGTGRLMGVGTDWLKYEGEFSCGKMEGFGEMWFYDGKRYKGQFRNDLPWGRGRMFGKNGEIQNGNWQRGNFLSEF